MSPAATATATPLPPDTRATTVTGAPKTCRSAAIPGDIVEVTAQVRQRTSVDITGIPGGYQVLGVVVQGTSSYNKYPNLGTLPWRDLRAPGDGTAEMTNWFACAKPRPSSPAPTTTTSVTTSSTSAPATVTPTSTSTTTTSAVVAQPPDDDDLARTGFGTGGFLIVATLLILAGAVILVVVRRRHTIQAK
ncbi:hypothetical protein [Kibdelosporangium phytohabitans]|uniref:Gram-positive cocci surface proteins LPxTG domain-containing protein n=1 Tax=Kibdelosporangium phytohabitans TaxID=860235 RepID=A0A0N9IEV2_9PSEU|nr:hypothetical protein [Kibdelosporangium phytohabitans]ALG13741.1 hypothetical protein AOZ06_48905 [Kibdelosporangium phytohabitans]MBE1465638.1 hypothetical protein [Kibdelosporangium phytohabitans]